MVLMFLLYLQLFVQDAVRCTIKLVVKSQPIEHNRFTLSIFFFYYSVIVLVVCFVLLIFYCGFCLALAQPDNYPRLAQGETSAMPDYNHDKEEHVSLLEHGRHIYCAQ